MLPLIGNRPNAPNTWPFSTAPTFNMARHHILPYNVLRDAWNNLVNVFVETQHSEARTAIRQFMMLCDPRLTNIEETLERLRHNEMSVVECNTYETIAVWAPWNIVDGPANRSDDPRDAYLDRFTFGVTRAEFARMDVLERLYNALQFFNNVAPPPPLNLALLAETLNHTRREIGFVELPIPFREGMWERQVDGRWAKRRSGEQFIPG
jgi:hypothetical protein